jgi:hypothetical protein
MVRKHARSHASCAEALAVPTAIIITLQTIHRAYRGIELLPI